MSNECRYKPFGSRVREVMTSKGITVEKLADTMGVSDHLINKIIFGRSVGFDTFLNLVNALGVGADFLIQDIVILPKDLIGIDAKGIVMCEVFSKLTAEQKDEILRLSNFFNSENEKILDKI